MNKLSLYIVIALFVGGVVGIIFHSLQQITYFASADTIGHVILFGSAGLLEIITFGGDVFIRLLKMLVVPLVLLSLTTGASQLNINSLSRLGSQTLGIYLATTAVAISLALIVASFIDPGQYIQLDSEAFSFTPKDPGSIRDVLLGIVPTNPVAALANANMLQIITFALLLGVALSQLGKRSETLRSILEVATDAMIVIVMWVIKLAPIGVFCLITKVFAAEGANVFQGLVVYFLTLILILALHVTLVYSFIVAKIAKLDVFHFYRKMRNNMLFAFSTSSSNATLPITLRNVEKELGVDKSVCSFTIPLGATINLDGTAIMQGTATVFIASVYGIDLQFTDYLTIMLTATLASIGTAGVPGAGLILLALVLEQAGLPVEAIGLVLGVDRLLDMARTAVNVCGDAAVTCAVAKLNNKIDRDVFAKDPA